MSDAQDSPEPADEDFTIEATLSEVEALKAALSWDAGLSPCLPSVRRLCRTLQRILEADDADTRRRVAAISKEAWDAS
jgi:hypothetical protein